MARGRASKHLLEDEDGGKNLPKASQNPQNDVVLPLIWARKRSICSLKHTQNTLNMDPILDGSLKTKIAKNEPFLKVAFQYGLVLGVASAILQLGAWMMDINPQDPKTDTMPKLVLGLAGILLSVLIYRLVMVEHRDKAQGGFINLKECATIGAIIGLASGIVGAVYLNLFGTVINPNFLSEMKANSYAVWEEQGLSEEVMDQTWGFTKLAFEPVTGAILQLIGGPIGGAIMGFIIGLFVRRER
jgi:hypothetical protein